MSRQRSGPPPDTGPRPPHGHGQGHGPADRGVRVAIAGPADSTVRLPGTVPAVAVVTRGRVRPVRPQPGRGGAA